MKKMLLALLLGAATLSPAQEKSWLRTDSLYKYVQPFAIVQFWGTYTTGEKARLTEDGPLEPVSDRFNFSFRRARLGFRGQPYKNFGYYLAVYYDNLGRDRYSGNRAGVNDAEIRVWDAYMTWKMGRNDAATLTAGYFRPQLSRENITAAFAVNSFEKSSSQTYIRQHLVGKGHGRTTGINLGGIRQRGPVSIQYNAGIFNNTTTGEESETAGRYWSPLLVGRVSFTLGDPEMKKYGISYDINYYNNRRGVTLGFNASKQGRTDAFSRNTAAGADLLINYRNLNLDGECLLLERTREGTTHRAYTGHVRAGYNLLLHGKLFLEPTFMATGFNGPAGARFEGQDRVYDAGINWYLNKKDLKLNLHYIWQEGHGRNGFTDEETFRKGDYLGLGLQVIL
jgi:hypothetical protein